MAVSTMRLYIELTAMFKNLLLPVDMSEKHQPALDAAVNLARRNGGRVTLLHVIEVVAGLPVDEEKAFYGRLEKAARKHVGQMGEALKQQNVSFQAEILYGHRGPEIVKYANENGIDLIVLTSPRFDPNNMGVSWGSLSYKISVLASCPVLLVK
jgi:nucleotide-binding universal stress UspA family protein